MKPPYVEITAECSKHGRFQVQRKPNKRHNNGSGRPQDGLYDAVKCLKCSWWATIIEQKLVTAAEEQAADQQIGLPDIS